MTRSKPREKADWVYRPDARATGGSAEADTLGTYEPIIKTLASGIESVQVPVLYDSRDHMTSTIRGSITTSADLATSARAEGRRAKILGYEGIMYVEPTQWAIGNLIALGVRVKKCTQDTLTGLAVVDPAESMWQFDVPSQQGPWTFANGYPFFVEERRVHYGFSDNQVFTVLRFRRKCRVSLAPNEMFAMWLELEPTSVNVRIQLWMRTLVSDEG